MALEMEPAARLESSWSGSASPKAWRGRLGDDQVFAIERGREGDLLFRYGARARFHLDAKRRRLGCAPSDPAGAAWRRMLLTRVLPNVGIAHGYEALHASAVLTDRGVVAIAAASGTGKSTLALELVKRGWPLFADDTVVLGRRGETIEAYPAAPFVNLPAAAGDVRSLGTDLGLVDGERWVAVANPAGAAAEVAAIVLLEREPGQLLGAGPAGGSPLVLAPFMLGLPDDEGRDSARFALYADLVERAQLLRLTADAALRPADLAEMLERALGLTSRVPVEEAA
ncbi:MAG TPA: hypothetical protein VH042_04305 [Solirubrobacterales bacterium]|nr:hypothetical protein [Solirubrobacterales bacterium]